MVYTSCDSIWIWLQPTIVRNSSVLLIHHAMTMILLIQALVGDELMKHVAPMAVVEFNTLLITLRRHVKHGLVEALFVSTWVGLRVLWFPVVAVRISRAAISQWRTRGPMSNILIVACANGLAAMQLLWTHDALMSFRKRRQARRALA